jgi:DNA invertase Pin-like site-specific DNA recombinase
MAMTQKPLRVGLYSRVSTSDRNQDPETQLLPLREHCQAHGWQTVAEFIDHASATDLRGRTAWRDLLALAARRKVDAIVVWKLDRCFRSVAHASTTLEHLRRWGVSLRSYTEPWADTASPQGELVFNLLTTFAAFERGLIAERVKAGMDRARRQGRVLGRPGGTRVDGFEERWAALRPRVVAGDVSRRAAARTLGVSDGTLRRLLAGTDVPEGSPIPA